LTNPKANQKTEGKKKQKEKMVKGMKGLQTMLAREKLRRGR
jgi:hypothetical protein